MLAVPGSQILSEGMTQTEVQTAMEQLRSTSTVGALPSTSGSATPLMKAAARRLSQEAAISSGDSSAGAATASLPGGAAPLGRRLSTDAAATAALLQEASHMSHMSHMSHTSKFSAAQQRHSDDEEAEPLDVNTAVYLAEACAQVRARQWLQPCHVQFTGRAIY